LGDLLDLEPGGSAPHRLSGVAGDQGDRSASQSLRSDDPVDDLVIVDGQPYMPWRIMENLERDSATTVGTSTAGDGDGDEHTAITRDALLPPSAADELIRILGRDGAHVSATTTLRDLADPGLRLREAAARYHDAVLAGAEHLLGLTGLDRLDQDAEHLLPGLSSTPAWPVLRSHLALISLEGNDPATALRDAIECVSSARREQ
jgi:hypothetical protein